MNGQRGFTLIEAVMAIAIAGVVIGVVSVFIVPATEAYFATTARAQLGDQADTALRRISRDLAVALPNSARVSASGQSLELIPVSSAARYASETGVPPVYGVNAPAFTVLGPPLNLSHAGQQLAWYNLGPDTPDANAYNLSNVRTATTAAGSVNSVSFAGASLPSSLIAPPYRVYAIESPVTYRCDTSGMPTVTGTLTRYSGYTVSATQPDPPSSGGAVLARNVAACSFSFDPAAVAARYALVTLRLTLKSQDESVTLYQTVHVDNLP